MKHFRTAVIILIAMPLLATAHPIPSPEYNSVRVIPAFEKEKDGHSLILPKRENGRNTVSWPAHAPHPSVLAKNRTYDVDLIEQAWVFVREDGSAQLHWMPTIERVADGEDVIFDASICEVHRAAMKRAQLRVVRGYFLGIPCGILQARRDRFPNTATVIGGGCHVEGGNHWVYWSCPDCEAGVKHWDQSNLPVGVIVGGAIEAPGPKNFAPGTTLSELLKAIRWSPNALENQTRRVRLFRDGEVVAFEEGKLNAKTARQFLLQHGDIIDCDSRSAHENGAEQAEDADAE